MNIKTKTIISRCLFFILCMNLPGCSRKERLYKDTAVIAGTFIEVTSPHKNAANIVFSTMKDLEKVFDIYNKESQISKVNAKAGASPVEVDKELIELLKLSKQLHTLTNGAFDPSMGKITLFWKEKMKDKKIDKFPETAKLKNLTDSKGMDYVEIDEQKHTVFIKKKGLSLDLGAVAKGYMIDKAAEALKKNNINSALINAGGDIYCLGRKNGRPWHIGIRDPESVLSMLQTLDIADEAVATSGDYEQFFKYKDKIYSHIIDPQTGSPVEGPLRSVTVIAHNATTADGLATAFFVMGKEKIQDFLQKNKSNLKILLVEEKEGEVSIHCFGPLF